LLFFNELWRLLRLIAASLVLRLQFDGDYLKGLVTQIFRKVYERIECHDLASLRLDVLRPARKLVEL
jgi:hypothetical protein